MAVEQRILLTGFEPFGGEAVNPSWQTARALHGTWVGALQAESVCLPCAFGDALIVLAAALSRARPSIVLALGQAASRSELSIERVAINIDDARIADNLGRQPVDAPVIEGAPAAYFATLPIKVMARAVRDAGIPVAMSQTAGTFVCNHVFYALMHRLRQHPGVLAGFMHVPLSTAQRAQGNAVPMPLETMVRGVRVALLAAQAVAPEEGGALVGWGAED